MKSLSGAALITTLIVTLVGCGGGDPPAPDRLAGLSAQEILDQSRTATAEVGAFQLGVGANVTATSSNGVSSVVRDALAGSITIDGAGPVNEGNATFDFEASLGGLPGFQGNITAVNGRAFIGILGTDYRLDIPPQRVRNVRPAALPSGMLDWIAEPAIAGRETIEKRDHVIISGKLNLDQVGGDLVDGLAVVQGRTLSPAVAKSSVAQLSAGLKTQSVKVWIAPDTLLPSRAEAMLEFSGRIDAFPQISQAELTADLRFTKYGTAVTITAPTTDEVLDLARLRGLLGG